MLSPSHNVVGERGEGFTVDMRSMKMTCFGAHPEYLTLLYNLGRKEIHILELLQGVLLLT